MSLRWLVGCVPEEGGAAVGAEQWAAARTYEQSWAGGRRAHVLTWLAARQGLQQLQQQLEAGAEAEEAENQGEEGEGQEGEEGVAMEEKAVKGDGAQERDVSKQEGPSAGAGGFDPFGC